MDELDGRRLRAVYEGQCRIGGWLPWEEWKEKVSTAYLELIRVARARKTITYGELGYGKLGISEEWLLPKIGWIVGACSEYEFVEGHPLLSSVVVSAETNMPGKGYWGLPGIPNHLRRREWQGQIGKPELVEAERERFWVAELSRLYEHWQKHEP